MIAPFLCEDNFPMCHCGADLVLPSNQEAESAWTKLGTNQDPGEPCSGIAEQNICGGKVGEEVHLLSWRNIRGTEIHNIKLYGILYMWYGEVNLLPCRLMKSSGRK